MKKLALTLIGLVVTTATLANELPEPVIKAYMQDYQLAKQKQ